jgi:FAD/FMN-containing dehydrogenase/Fe-S oxidoreductase
MIAARELARDLSRELAGEVRFGSASRALYATDASNFRQVPIGVVIPQTLDDVVATHEICRRHGAPITCRGGGTSLSGETVNVAVIVDFSKYLHEILEFDLERRLVRVQPGAINELVNEAAGEHGLVFGPDPSTHAYCTIGGNVGNNSCGAHSVLAAFEGDGGRTSDNLHELEILTYDGLRLRVGATSDQELDAIVRAGGRRGEIYAALRDLRDRYAELIRERFPRIPRRVSGYNLDELLPENGFNVARALAGTEGTCVTVLEATLQLVPSPRERALVVIPYDDVFEAADHAAELMEHRPIACEGLDDVLVSEERLLKMHRKALELLPEGGGWLLVEFGGETAAEAQERARAAVGPVNGAKLVDDPQEQRLLWQAREAGLGASAFPPEGPRDAWEGWEDSAVPPERLGDYLRDLRRLLELYGLKGPFYGHFGQGCLHTRTTFDLRSTPGLREYRAFLEEAADLVVSYGGSFSGEHGDGQQRAELLPKMFGDELVQAFRDFKAIWDPDGRMNPGKVVDAHRFDEDLKLGVESNPWRPQVRFSYAEDDGDFAHATLRCVGVGACRTPGAADVMCPSYVVTREEMHTTRGRARLLWEMLRGEVVADGWRSEEVKEALDLCLACKGCTADCPVSVDMPTLKAEFLHHYYAHRPRPRHAYAFGLVDQAARIASRTPRLVNLVANTGPAKRAAGIAPERDVPRFATTTFKAWFRRRGGPRHESGPPVILWPDTFTNFFHPEVGVAAVETLEGAGYRVLVPMHHACCGRPLYDYGMLDLAERYLRRVIGRLRKQVRAGVPVVGVEPSCVAVFKDELPKLLRHDDDARRLTQQTFHFAEFLRREGIEPPARTGRALVWGHCHQKATGGMEDEHAILRATGLDVEPVTGGCCGLAGSFGFEAAHYELSIACGEHELLPRVREAPADVLVVADGFSCRTQIAHGTGRRALHVAEVLAGK